MITDKTNLSGKLSTISLLVVLLALIALAITSYTLLRNGIQILAQEQEQQTQNSERHNAIGHGSHQVVNLQNASEGEVYNGTVTFNSSEPVDIISYEDVTDQTDTNATIKIWEVDGKEYATKSLLKNATEGTLNFQGAGILTHKTSSEPYKVTFTVDVVPLDNSGQ